MNKIDYFWETKKYFEKFLKEQFGDNFKIKYSLTGNGIYDLLYINGKIYELKYTECRTKLEDNNIAARDDKPYIIDTIVNNLKCRKEDIITNSGKFIIFPVGKWYAKVEIIKKNNEPR